MSNTTDWIRREITYRGHVQGVGFRYTAHSIARKFDVTGFVRNLSDGTVRIVVEGPRAEVDSFVDELSSRMSHFIRSCDVAEQEPTGQYTGFEIQY